MKLPKINPALVIFLFGVGGLLFTFVEGSGQIGSKIPLTIFFMFIMAVGIILQALPKDKLDDTFGEMETRQDFG